MRILVVEDQAEMRERLAAALKGNGYQVDSAADGDEALDRAAGGGHDLILLDVMLPGRDGFSVLEHLRESGLGIPVLMLTALGGVDDRVRGLDRGADDYLAKPFSMAELLARIRSLLRRGNKRLAILRVGPLSIDPAGRRATLSDEPLDLTAREFAILEFLAYNQGRAVSRFDLAKHVWGDEFDPFSMSNFIDVHIKNLRAKLGDFAAAIRTVRGVGYLIEPREGGSFEDQA